MGLINFKDIDCKSSIDRTLKTIEFNGSEISIVPFLSTDEKYNLIMATVNKSLEKNGVYNKFKLHMYFNLNLIYSYTNIVFSIEDREDEATLYDKLSQSGLLKLVTDAIDKEQISELYYYIGEIIENKMKYETTFAYAVKNFLEKLPSNMKAAKEIIDSFDEGKYKQLMDIAQKVGVTMDIK